MTDHLGSGAAGAFVIDATPALGLGATCREILDTVPTWFGIPESNDEYVAFVDTHDTWVAYSDQREPIGLISGRRHFPETAEIEVLAVRREWHRHGVGRALIDVFETHHRATGARMLEVKTLGPSHDDEGYAATRQFYTGIGFIPIEEMWIWGPDNPALLLCKPIAPAP
ncbi:MAG: GNAT family N-acetyltransferase [Actinobacteria bacterium]|nr:GNAT family N-acetyltransferase [Actinomycetota bacterium]